MNQNSDTLKRDEVVYVAGKLEDMFTNHPNKKSSIAEINFKIPECIYDNPKTTKYDFVIHLHENISISEAEEEIMLFKKAFSLFTNASESNVYVEVIERILQRNVHNV
jgi:hypothetical protein